MTPIERNITSPTDLGYRPIRRLHGHLLLGYDGRNINVTEHDVIYPVINYILLVSVYKGSRASCPKVVMSKTYGL
jgi:hypothetical protein